MTVSAHDVARELRARQPGIDAVKIHKLLYYCQGWHLVWTGRPMFTERIEAWELGPVVADVGHAEDKGLPVPDARELGDAERATVGYVLARYGGLSGRDLAHLTHAEDPWRHATDLQVPNAEILLDEMHRFFAGDDEIQASAALAEAAFASTETRRFFVDAAAETENASGAPDDPREIKRRLEALR